MFQTNIILKSEVNITHGLLSLNFSSELNQIHTQLRTPSIRQLDKEFHWVNYFIKVLQYFGF